MLQHLQMKTCLHTSTDAGCGMIPSHREMRQGYDRALPVALTKRALAAGLVIHTVVIHTAA